MIVVHVQGRTGIHNHDKKSETNGLLERPSSKENAQADGLKTLGKAPLEIL